MWNLSVPVVTQCQRLVSKPSRRSSDVSALNIQSPWTAVATATSPLLDAFRQAAQTHDAVRITLDGADWQVQGVGTMPQSRREVAWVSPDAAQPDTTSVFVQALEQSFSSGLSAAVARSLDLRPAPGQALSSRTVNQAVDMAQTGQQALSGVDFLTRLQFSAASNGPEFRRVCESLGQEAGAVTQERRQHIDAQMDARFAQAHASGASPVSGQQAEQWLRQALE